MINTIKQAKTTHILALMSMIALAFRLSLLVFIHNPGMDDSLHYVNLGRRILQGDGLTIDYTWQYLRLYDDLIHPVDYWMPLTGFITAGSMAIWGVNTLGAVLPFILLGSVLPILSYLTARQLKLGRDAALIAAALTIGLPELIWQSTRPLTTVPQMWLVGISIILLISALQGGRWWAFAVSGLCAGLAYLNRSDALLLVPMIGITLFVYLIWQRDMIRRSWLFLILMPLMAAIVVAPLSIRNQRVLGQTGMVETSRVFFFVKYNDHHSYDNDRITLSRLLDELAPAQIIGKRLFELLAASKQMIVSLQPVVIIGVAGGIVLMLWRRDKTLFVLSAPILILLLGIFVAYPIFIPMKAQGGSFRTAFATLIPLLLPFFGYAMVHTIQNRTHQIGLTTLIVILSMVMGADKLRLETAQIDQYHQFVQEIVAKAEELPDVNGDGDVRLMTQDPLALSYYGLASAIVPNGSRDEIIAVAQRYRIDYVMLPTAWTDLDRFHGQAQSDDPRFVFTDAIERPGRLPAEFYAILPDAD